jgi:hypothetical protein
VPRERLRIFAVLDGPLVPAWVHRILLDLTTSEVAELAAVRLGAGEVPRRRRGGLAFRAYQALDRRLFEQPGDPLAPVDASPLLERCGRAATPSEARADVVLKLAGASLPAEWVASAPLGVWSFDHVECEGRGGVPFFWELARHHPVTETALRTHTAAGSRVLARGFAATDPTSLTRGRHAPLWKSAGLLARALRDATEPAEPEAERGSAGRRVGPEREPGPLALARLIAAVGLRVGFERVRRLSHEEPWFVALRRSEGSLVDGPMHGFVPVPMPGDRFYADPFLVPDGDRLWLFCEDAERASGKGVIRCSEVRADGTIGESHVVLECDCHLSYPFVFQRDGAWFMLPETSGHRTVELWHAVQFPWQWKLEKVLLSDVCAVDPTLFEHEGRLWLFAGASESGGAAQDELFLYFADSLAGDWRPHPRNPVVSDVRHARPAGPLFREGGEIYRPGQDCSGAYGSAFWIHRVERLDERGYRETPVRRVNPAWYPRLTATHSIHRAGGFDAIDGRLWLRRGEGLPRPHRAGTR